MADPNGGDLKRGVLKKFGLLLDTLGDIGRSGLDTEFSRPKEPHSDRIYYVFDENVFELFVNPKDNLSFCSNFYGRGWERGPRSRDYTAQAALIAGEYLFSGSLPGFGPDGQILVSEWHYYQLIRRLREMRTTLRHADQNQSSTEQIQREAEAGAQRREQIDQLSIDEIIRSIRNKDLREDARIFADTIPREYEQQAEAAVRRFVLARERAPLLANDLSLEPLQQIGRVYEDILPHIKPLSAAFWPENEHEEQLLREWIALWVRVFGDEKITDRGEIGIDSDARTVGYVHWVAQWKLKRTERIVLVTGDSRLFNAYRRWHSGRDAGEAFLLRRINQYSPLLNPHDAPNEIAEGNGAKPIFETLRSALDAPMLTFNLGIELADKGVAGQLDPRREYFAEFLINNPHPENHPITQFFTHHLDDGWWSLREKSFEQLKQSWQAAERAAIGISYPALETRWTRRQGVFAVIAERAQDGDWSAVFSEYIAGLLAKIARDGLDSDISFAIDIVQSRLQASRSINTEPRAPLRIQLRLPLPGGEVRAFAEVLSECENGDERAADLLNPMKNDALRRRTDLVFAVAAALTLRAQLWAHAERFASDALNALGNLSDEEAAALGLGGEEREIVRGEYEYLSVIARRFLVAETQPSSEPTMERPREQDLPDAWQPHLLAIERTTKRLLSFHGAKQPRRRFRSLVELVASRAFYLMWGAVMTEDELRHERFDHALAFTQCQNAIREIRRAWSLADSSDVEIAPASRLQLAVNAGLMDLFMLSPNYAKRWRHHSFSSDERQRIKNELGLLDDVRENVPPIVAVDAYAFLYWLDRDPEYLRLLTAAKDQKVWKELPIDGRWGRSIHDWLKRLPPIEA